MTRRVVFRSHFSPYRVEDNRSKTQGEIRIRSFPIVMTVTGYSAPLTIRTIRISNKRCQLRIRARPDCAPRRTTVSISNARRGNSKNNFRNVAVFRRNWCLPKWRNNKTGSPWVVKSMRLGQVSTSTVLSNRESFGFV